MMYYPYLGGAGQHNMAPPQGPPPPHPSHHSQHPPQLQYAYSPSDSNHSPYPQHAHPLHQQAHHPQGHPQQPPPAHHHHQQHQHQQQQPPPSNNSFLANKMPVPSSTLQRTSPAQSNKRTAKVMDERPPHAVVKKRSRLASEGVGSSASGGGTGAVADATIKSNRDGSSGPDSISHVTVFQCMGFGDCKMTFTRSEHLARHVRKHTGERPFKCHCGKAFSRLDNLRQHAHTVHAKTPELNEKAMRELTALHSDLAASAAQAQQAHATIMPRSVYEAEAAANAMLPSESQARRKTLKYSKRDNPGSNTGGTDAGSSARIKTESRRQPSPQQKQPRRSLSSQASPWAPTPDSLGAASISPHDSSPFASHGPPLDRYGMPIAQPSPYGDSPQANMAYEFRSERTGSGSGASAYEASSAAGGTPYGSQQPPYYESYRPAPQAMVANAVVPPAPLQAPVMSIYPASTYSHYTGSHDEGVAAGQQYEEQQQNYPPPPRPGSQQWSTAVQHAGQTGNGAEEFYSWGQDMPFASDVRRNSNPFAYGAETVQGGGYQSILSAHLQMHPGGRVASPPLPPSPSTLAAAGRPVLPPLSSLSRPGTSSGLGGSAPVDAERPVSASGLGLRPSSSWGLEGLFGSIGGGSISSASGIGSASVLQSIGAHDDSNGSGGGGTGRLPSISLHLQSQNGESRRPSDVEGLLGTDEGAGVGSYGTGERRDSLPPLAAALDVDGRRGSLKWAALPGAASSKRPQTASTTSGSAHEGGSSGRPSLLSSLASSVLDRDRERVRPSTSSTTASRGRRPSLPGHQFGSTGSVGELTSPTHTTHASPFMFAPPPLPAVGGTQAGVGASHASQSGGVKWNHPRPFGSTSSWSSSGVGGRASFDEEAKRSGWLGREWGSGSSGGRAGSSSSGVGAGGNEEQHRRSNTNSSTFSASSSGGRLRISSANAIGPLDEEPFAHPSSPTSSGLADARQKARSSGRPEGGDAEEEEDGAGDERRLSIASLLGAGASGCGAQSTPQGSGSMRKESSSSARLLGSSESSEAGRSGGASRSSYATTVSMGPGGGSGGKLDEEDEGEGGQGE